MPDTPDLRFKKHRNPKHQKQRHLGRLEVSGGEASFPVMDTRGLTSLICVALLILETSVGVLVSVYVIIIILLDFYKKKNMRTGNKIRIALSLSNVCFSIITSANTFSGFYWSATTLTTSANYILYPFTMFCISSCSWLSASLSFFYFIKIVNVKTKCFIWVKTNISSIVSWVILLAEIVSFGSFICVFFLIVPQPISSNTSVSSYSAVAVSDHRSRFIYMIIVVTFLPLLTVLVTTITTAMVLTQHRQKMEQNMGPSVRLETYNSSIYRMLRLLFFFYHVLHCDVDLLFACF
ncbi:taste receptor type 2 member 39-like [Hyla sarda]|uniref:taste receptor type 2 member 39-like n=1 Tax=Hyla sarda TaxID=327740 RepID=UPI0024C3E453|nr:taste receptor type 2 member 39-like [Hyla sarda]